MLLFYLPIYYFFEKGKMAAISFLQNGHFIVIAHLEILQIFSFPKKKNLQIFKVFHFTPVCTVYFNFYQEVHIMIHHAAISNQIF